MPKIIIIEMCEHCPHFVQDPDYNIEFWGKAACTHDPGEMKEVENEISVFCPLQDTEC